MGKEIHFSPLSEIHFSPLSEIHFSPLSEIHFSSLSESDSSLPRVDCAPGTDVSIKELIND